MFQSIACLWKEKTLGTLMDFNAKEIMEETQIFNGEFTSQLRDKPLNPIWVVTDDYHIINVE